MESKERIFKLKGVVQHYAWGGSTFIPELLGLVPDLSKPSAEYWMGAHSSAPSQVFVTDTWRKLNEIISSDPSDALLPTVVEKFGELPYLFKVLDVKDMLSIQVHPTKENAEKGYDAENQAGIPLDAPHRNYKDRNHKPEVMVALSDFWLLHGFKSKQELEDTLQNTQELTVLLPLFKKEGIKGLYQFVMEMDQVDVDNLLAPLIKRSLLYRKEGSISKSNPCWWTAKLYEDIGVPEHIDRGIFSIFFFNIVQVHPGEAVFQKAGVPHAYLEGQNIELMANSDNVLRGGLTPKHVDVPELMKHTLFEEVIPQVMKGVPVLPGEINYPCPVPDFGLSKISLEKGMEFQSETYSLEIFIVTEGSLLLSQKMVLKKGECAAILAKTKYTLLAPGHATVFKAFVPVS